MMYQRKPNNSIREREIPFPEGKLVVLLANMSVIKSREKSVEK